LNPRRKIILPNTGYSLDILVNVDGEDVGIEVDGPSHFIEREPMGKTVLKRG
jgi:hypothetical protein